jgi:hypothetical protein
MTWTVKGSRRFAAAGFMTLIDSAEDAEPPWQDISHPDPPASPQLSIQNIVLTIFCIYIKVYI